MEKAKQIVLRYTVDAVGELTRSTHNPNCKYKFIDLAEYCCQGINAVNLGKRYLFRNLLMDIGDELLLRAYGEKNLPYTDLSQTLLFFMDILFRFSQRFYDELKETDEFDYLREKVVIFIDFANAFEIPGNAWDVLSDCYESK